MRDPNRLYPFYNEVMRIHMEYFPDLRCGQMIYTFNEWLKITTGADMFYLEESYFLKKLDEYAKRSSKY